MHKGEIVSKLEVDIYSTWQEGKDSDVLVDVSSLLVMNKVKSLQSTFYVDQNSIFLQRASMLLLGFLLYVQDL